MQGIKDNKKARRDSQPDFAPSCFPRPEGHEQGNQANGAQYPAPKRANSFAVEAVRRLNACYCGERYPENYAYLLLNHSED